VHRYNLSASLCSLWRDITAGDNREGPSAIFGASHLITDKGIRTGGCYLHEPRINPPERSPQSRRPEVFYARSPDPQVIE